jgi:hypothetical protein
MGDSLVSSITPVLNRVETMGACLASIARQTLATDRAHRGRWRIYGWDSHLLREYRASSLRLRKRARKTARTKPSIGGS